MKYPRWFPLLAFLLLLPLAPADVGAVQVSEHVISPLGDLLIFQSPTGGLWRTDGTQNGTFRLAPTCRFPYYCHPLIGQAGGRMLFMVEVAELSTPNDRRHQIWATDGTVDGTHQITFFPGGLPPLSLWTMTDYRSAPGLGLLFFRVTLPETGAELWVSDGTPTGTRLVVDLAPGPRDGLGRFLGETSGRFLFEGFSEEYGAELWSSDGTTAGTRLLRDFVPGPESSQPRALTPFEDHLFFTFDNPARQHELWISDDSATGVRLLDLLDPPRPDGTSRSRWLRGVQGESQAFLQASQESQGPYLVRSDGTPSGTYSLHGSTDTFIAFGDSVLFIADEPEYGEEPWVSDGTREGTHLLRDLVPGPVGIRLLTEPVQTGSLAYLVTSMRFDWYTDYVGWVTDGTTAGTVPFFSFSDVNRAYAIWFAAGPDNHLYFRTVRTRCLDELEHECVAEPELWVTPAAGGDLGSTARVVDPSSVLSLYGLPGFQLVGAPLGDLFLFVGSDAEHGTALWRSDASPEGTYPLIELEAPKLPDPIARLTATPADSGTGEITLDWSPAARADTYNIALSSPEDGFRLWSGWIWEHTYTLTRLVPGSPYAFRVQAVNSYGTSPWSEPVAATPLPALITPCVPDAESLCLHGSRFEVKVAYRDHLHGTWDVGHTAPLDFSDDSGAFWFFDHDNLELMVKVLDARTVNGYFWSFFGGLTTLETWITVTDTEAQTNATFYKSPDDLCGQAEVKAFPRPAFEALVTHGTCEPGPDHLCLTGDRYRVEVSWRDQRSGHTGVGHAIPGTEDSGFFWFFDHENVELLVKVLDARTVNGHVWVFSGAMTDVEYTLTVTDTLTGERQQYVHPPGSLCGQADVAAF